MVGNLSKKCKLCNGTITHGNTKRHNDRHHAGHLSKSASTTAATALELRRTLSEVLESCNIPQELWPAERKVLDRLQNYRLLENQTTSFDMPGEPRLQILDDSKIRQALPPLEELVVRVAVALGKGNGGTQLEKVPKDLVVRVVTPDKFDKELISLGRILGRWQTPPVTLRGRRIVMAQQDSTKPR